MKGKKQKLVLIFFIFLVVQIHAKSPRTWRLLDKWNFTEDVTSTDARLEIPSAQAKWVMVSVPHIFRQSGLPDNTAGWYRQTLNLKETDRNHRYLLVLEGATAIKDVFVNGRHIGQHKSAYTASAFDLTPALEYGKENQIAVRVSNRDEEIRGVMVRSSLYYNNGGMFRKAWLVRTEGPVYIYPEMGSGGVFLSPAHITPQQADLNIRTVVSNPKDQPVNVEVRSTVTDPTGKKAGVFSTKARLAANETSSLKSHGVVANPKLWNLKKPNLYNVRTELLVDGKLSDCVTEHTGFRTIEWKNKQFYVNGSVVQFHGVNKHAQDEYDWNAISDKKLRQEWDWILKMGNNAVRLAHYPHSHFEYNIADENGIAIWAENGFAGHEWTEEFPEDRVSTPNGERITREMVLQNWNHPSIFFWSAGNETVVETVDHYADVIRAEKDSNRLITYASCGKVPKKCDFVAHNTYHGWYYGDYTDFKKGNELVSETGSSTWMSHHVPYGIAKWEVNKFEPEEYSEIFTEFRLQTICRDDVAKHPMFFWWNFREFYDHKFKMNRNSKGLVTLGGLHKDIAYLFQAFFNPDEPLVHLNGRFHFLRRFDANNGIKAYANVPELELFVNGISQGKMKNGEYRIPDIGKPQKDKNGNQVVKFLAGTNVDNVFFWNATLKEGRNMIEVTDGKGHSDKMVIYQNTPGLTMPGDAQAIVQNLGSSNAQSPVYFIDRPVEAQAPFYSDVDGSSDNTFDVLPKEIEGASWIATRRLSDEQNKTDISFDINKNSKGTVVSVLFSKGTYPVITLKNPNDTIRQAAGRLEQTLAAEGFTNTNAPAVWRDHMLERTNAALWQRIFKPGEKCMLPGNVLDYIILIKPQK